MPIYKHRDPYVHAEFWDGTAEGIKKITAFLNVNPVVRFINDGQVAELDFADRVEMMEQGDYAYLDENEVPQFWDKVTFEHYFYKISMEEQLQLFRDKWNKEQK